MSYFLSPPIHLGRKPEQLIPSFRSLFHKLYLAVTSGLLEKMATNKNHDGKWSRVKKTSRQNVTRKAASSDNEIRLENRFALLYDIGEEQGEDEDP